MADPFGRNTFSTWAPVPIPEGEPVGDTAVGFAAAAGYRNTLEHVVQICDLDSVDEAGLEQLWTEALRRAEGFELVTFEGAPPAELRNGLAYLYARMYTDMPLGEWDLQEADFDVNADDGPVSRTLVAEDAALGLNIAVHAAMARQVVRREVEHHRHFALQRLDEIEEHRRGPVDVVENDQQRTVAGALDQQTACDPRGFFGA